VRLYKTRTIATNACDSGRILISGKSVKASRLVKPGDEVHVKRTGLTRIYRVLQLAQSRLAAKLVPDYCTELTPPELLEEYRTRMTRFTSYRDPGTGRPTKKERRALDDFMDPEFDLPENE